MPTDWRRARASTSRLWHSIDCTCCVLPLRYLTSSSAVGRAPGVGSGSRGRSGVNHFLNTQPLSDSSIAARVRPVTTRRIAPSLLPSAPPEHAVDFVLHVGHFRLGQARVGHLVAGAG